jgi:HSP20 family molecular chaperone IbpA
VNDLREFGRSAANAILERLGRGMSRMQERGSIPHDLLEGEDAYLIVFDTPGATSSDVQVRFLDGAVQVRVDRFREFHEGYEMRFPGRGLSLDGSVSLPADSTVDADGASATLRENGTLEVRVPKEGGSRVAVEETGEHTESDGDDAGSGAGADADSSESGSGDSDGGRIGPDNSDGGTAVRENADGDGAVRDPSDDRTP